MSYRHGVYVSEVPTSVLSPVAASAGLPVVFGTAPINLVDNPSAVVNKPILVSSYEEAVKKFGFVPARNGRFDFTISEFMQSHFALFAVAPVVFVNVLDPAEHSESVASEPVTLNGDTATLLNVGVVPSSIVVKSDDGQNTFTADDDYVITFNQSGFAVVNRVDGGSISANDALAVDYDYLDPSAVGPADVIGGIDGSGNATGLELVNQVFPVTRLVPGQIVAPGYSSDPAVAAVMQAKASNINNHFKADALIDVPTDTVTNYTAVAQWKNDNNVVGSLQTACWPMVSLGGTKYHMSTQLAGLTCKVDSENADIPYRSVSNQNLQMDSAVLADGTEVFLGPEQAALLNGQGVVTALNFVGGWKAWGNRTAAYPAVTDPKDSFRAIRRMFNWVGNTLTLTFWQRLDFPLNRRQIQTVLDSANIFLNGLVAQGYLIGGRVEFRQDENPTTDLLDGIARFHVYLTPPSPNREINFILEYDASYLETLFG